MPHASCSSRQLTALSLSSLYTLASLISSTVLLWAIAISIKPESAISQTPAGVQQQPGSRQLLEDARQRLIDGGEITPPVQSVPPTPITPAPTQPLLVQPSTIPEFDVYRLGPGDSLFVNVLRFPDLSFQGTLDLQGNIVVPLVGVVSLRGLTVDQAQALIRAELDNYIVNPQVEMTLVAQRPVEVTVIGEVVRPGFYPLAAPQLATALFSAGGTTGQADMRAVQIRRALGNGAVIEQTVDLYTPLKESSALPNVRLEDGDTIVIPSLTAITSSGYNRDLVSTSNLARQQINIRVLNYATGRGRGDVGGGGLNTLALPNGSRFADALTAIAPNLDNANLRSVALIRFDQAQGKAVTQQIDGRSVIRGDMSQNPPLEHNDVIVVGRNLVARLTYALGTFTQPFRDVLGFLLFFDTLRDSATNLFGPTDNND